MTRKPKIAFSPEEQCCGFTKDHRRCRLKRTSEKTCRIHRNYYNQWFIHLIHAMDWRLTKRERKEIEFQIRHRHVIFTKDDVPLLGNVLQHRQLLQKLFLWQAIHPLWIRKISEEVLTQYVFLYLNLWDRRETELLEFVQGFQPYPDAIEFAFDIFNGTCLILFLELEAFEQNFPIERDEIVEMIVSLWNFAKEKNLFSHFSHCHFENYFETKMDFFKRYLDIHYKMPEESYKRAIEEYKTIPNLWDFRLKCPFQKEIVVHALTFNRS